MFKVGKIPMNLCVELINQSRPERGWIPSMMSWYCEIQDMERRPSQ